MPSFVVIQWLVYAEQHRNCGTNCVCVDVTRDHLRVDPDSTSASFQLHHSQTVSARYEWSSARTFSAWAQTRRWCSKTPCEFEQLVPTSYAHVSFWRLATNCVQSSERLQTQRICSRAKVGESWKAEGPAKQSAQYTRHDVGELCSLVPSLDTYYAQDWFDNTKKYKFHILMWFDGRVRGFINDDKHS